MQLGSIYIQYLRGIIVSTQPPELSLTIIERSKINHGQIEASECFIGEYTQSNPEESYEGSRKWPCRIIT